MQTGMRLQIQWAGPILLLMLPCSSLSGQGQAPRYINPPSLVKPTGYTHVVVAPDGRTVYVAGQVALDSAGQLVGSGDFRSQAEQVFGNLRRALASVGGVVSSLARPDLLIEIEAVALLRQSVRFTAQ
jgi:enamine deaminase RidA (YjgF/YER057c/UK114 family)